MNYLAIAAVVFPMVFLAFYWLEGPMDNADRLLCVLALAAGVTLLILTMCWGLEYLGKEVQIRRAKTPTLEASPTTHAPI